MRAKRRCYNDTPEIGAKTGTRKPIPVSDASDMQFATEFFSCQFLVTNRTCSIFVPVYGTSLLVLVFGVYYGQRDSISLIQRDSISRFHLSDYVRVSFIGIRLEINILCYPAMFVNK